MKYNLSEIIDLIKDRRTIYPEQYSTRKVQKEQVEAILNAGIWAPTHGNTQPWRFTIFMDDAKEKLSDFLSETYLKLTPKEKQNDMKLAKMLNRPKLASVVIAICMKRDENEKIKEIEEIEAVACAVQNMHLVATAYGIGGFWSTPALIYSQEMNEFLNLDEKDKCLGLFYLGYPAIEWPKSHRKPIEYLSTWKNS
ncbi:MAG: nitroreductase [Bacteroidota bacterium]